MKKSIILIVLLSIPMILMAQDVIITKDARKIECKVTEISTYVVRYKKSSNLDGPTYMVEKVDIASITYANGEVEVFTEKQNENTQGVREEDALQTQVENPKLERQTPTSSKEQQTAAGVKFGMDVDVIGTVGKEKHMDHAGGSIGFDFHAGLHSRNRVNFIGLGLGLHWFFYNLIQNPMSGYEIKTKSTTLNMPIYVYDRISFQSLSFSGLMSKSQVVPYWEIAIGGNIQIRVDTEQETTINSEITKENISETKATGGFYLRTGLGLNCGGLQFGVGYEVTTQKQAAINCAYFKIAYGF